MASMIPWFLAIVLLGWLAFPIGYRLLRFLPDRAVGLAKPLGLLLWGFLFWLPASLRMIRNDAGGILVSLLLLAAGSWLAGRGRWQEMREWLRSNRRMWLTAEILFLVAFIFCAAVRAASPDATGTEKPMELAFINAILASPEFPPHDPWLSGYSISYYYFGYVIVAALAKLTGTIGSIAFNLGSASWFALAATAGYSVFYNLLEVVPVRTARRRTSFAAALLAPLFILFVGNFGGLLEALHGAGAFWDRTNQPAEAQPGEFPPLAECMRSGNAQVSSKFWHWLDIQELNCPPSEPYRFAPTRSGWWWWRSSRVLIDYDLDNRQKEVIDEFPAFSYLLGDLHPHVLSMPFVLLAIGLGFNLYLRIRQEGWRGSGWVGWLRDPLFWLAAVILGGLAFLNLWDFPIYLSLFVIAFGLALVQHEGRWERSVPGEAFRLAVLLGIAGVLLYLPFYLSFSSQAGGIIPSLSFFTRGIHFWVMFGTLMIPVCLWLLFTWPKGNMLRTFALGLGVSAGLVAVLWVLSYALGAFGLSLPKLGVQLAGLHGGADPGLILRESFLRRIRFPGMWISLLLILALTAGRILSLFGKQEAAPHESQEPDTAEDGETRVHGYVLLLALLAGGLILVPEFFYLLDQFGWRMNTIFKFYYQAWILLALVAAYAYVWIWAKASLPRLPLQVMSALILVGSLFFSWFGFGERLSSVEPRNLSLDGANYLRLYQPDLYGAIQWLRSAPAGVVAEAVGGSYQSDYARVATHSGNPTVLGWPGHEGQWRGGYVEVGTREADIAQVYTASSWSSVQEIINRYHIRYIVVGSAEYSKYGARLNEDLFLQHLDLAYDSPQARIFEVPQYARQLP